MGKKTKGHEGTKRAPSRRERLVAEQQAAARKEVRKKQVWIGAVVLILVLIAALVLWGISSNQKVTEESSPPNISEDGFGVVMFPGNTNEDAPVVDVYLDYQCPNCKNFEDAYGPTLEKMAQAGDIVLVNHTMNFMDGNLGNSASTRAAVAATCADWAGDEFYPRFNKAIFAQQGAAGDEGYTDQALRVDIPDRVGITAQDLENFQRCYDQEVPAPFVNRINDGALRAGVSTTPTLLRNGVPLTMLSNVTPEEFEQALIDGP